MTSPLEKFNRDNSSRWSVLQNIPEWEQRSIMGWISNVMNKRTSDLVGSTHTTYNYAVIRNIERNQRVILADVLECDTSNWPDLSRRLWHLIANEPERFILFLEFLVVYVRDFAPRRMDYGSSTVSDTDVLEYLQKSLSNGSKWKIVNRRNSGAGLTEVANEELRATAEKLKNNDLTQAWEAAFQPSPNPQLAIEKSQLAIEHAASEKNLTSVTSSVYGNLLGDIRKHGTTNYIAIAKPEYDLSKELAGEKSGEIDPNDQFMTWFWEGMNLIQKSNPARHKSKKTTNFKISAEAGKQAVLVATLLCELIDKGYIAKIDKSQPKADA